MLVQMHPNTKQSLQRPCSVVPQWQYKVLLTSGTCCFVPSTQSHNRELLLLLFQHHLPQPDSTTVLLTLYFHYVFHLRILKSTYLNKEK